MQVPSSGGQVGGVIGNLVLCGRSCDTCYEIATISLCLLAFLYAFRPSFCAEILGSALFQMGHKFPQSVFLSLLKVVPTFQDKSRKCTWHLAVGSGTTVS